MKPDMKKPSPQLVFSALVSTAAMGALALSSPSLSARNGSDFAVPAAALGTEMPSIPALPAFFPR